MQYILSKEEYAELINGKVKRALLAQGKLQTLCTKICNTMPVDWSWNKSDNPKPWGCTLTAADNHDEWYCNECPVIEICPCKEKCYS